MPHLHDLNLPKDLECCICQVGAIYNPRECETCNKIFCKHCINRCVRSGQDGQLIQCPSCKKRPISLKYPHRLVMSLLAEQMVPAHECCYPAGAPQVSYEALINHLEDECPHVQIMCPLCDEKLIERNGFLEHFKQCRQYS